MAYNRKMTRSISHEIRTPLNTAFMALELLISSLVQQEQQQTQSQQIAKAVASRSFDVMDFHSKSKEEVKKDVEDIAINNTNNLLEIAESIKEGCDIALNILNQLLTFEKLSAGMLQLENNTLTINQLLDNNMKLFKMQAQQCGITFKLDRSNVNMEELLVHVDEHKMNQVVRNLLSNAMKFTPRGGVVEVKLQWVHPTERDDLLNRLIRARSRSTIGEEEESSNHERSISNSAAIQALQKGHNWLKAGIRKLPVLKKSTSTAASGGSDVPVTLQSNTPLHHTISGLRDNGTILISVVDSGPGVSEVSRMQCNPSLHLLITGFNIYRLIKRNSFKNMFKSILVNYKRVKVQDWVSQSQSRSFTCMVEILE